MSNGKVIWITGASSGIGKALALACLKKGYRVILSSRRTEVLEDLSVRWEKEFPGMTAIVALDLARGDLLEEYVTDAVSAFGRVDILVNNGGISQRSLVLETDISVDRKLMEVNYFGNIGLAKLLLPHFLSNGGGQIVVVSSLVGKFGTPYRSGYSASKHALHGFYDSMRAELYDRNIHVTMICPGFIRTDVSLNALTGDGSPLEEMDQAQANGMSAEQCAKKMIRAFEKKRNEVYIGGREVFGVYLKRFFPSLFARLVRKARVR